MQYVIKVLVEVLNVVGIIPADEIVQGTEGWGDEGLYFEAIFRWEEENAEATLEDAEDSLNDISG